MKFIASIIWISLFLALPSPTQQAKGWHGIVPLHSSRSDIERLLGSSTDPCRCLYKRKNEIIHVVYSKQTCKDDPRGWDVPPDTVLLINISLKTEVPIADLKLDLTKYQKTDNKLSPGMSFYTRDDGGTFIIVTGKNEMVGSINYQPTKDDEKRY